MQNKAIAQIIQGNICGISIKKNAFPETAKSIKAMTAFNNNTIHLSELAADRILYHCDSFNLPSLELISTVSSVIAGELLERCKTDQDLAELDLFGEFCWTSCIDDVIEKNIIK